VAFAFFFLETACDAVLSITSQVFSGMKIMRRFGSLTLLLVGLAIVGCAGGEGAGTRLATHKVSGKVTQGGAPVPGATVTFSPMKNGDPGASGITDAQGMYSLTTYDANDGAVEGDYKVLVTKSAPVASGPSIAHDPTGQTRSPSPSGHGGGGAAAAAAGGGSLLPEKYARASDTPLMKTVAKGDNTHDLEIE